MSQIITLKRKISVDDLLAALEQVESLSPGEEHEWGLELNYAPNPNLLVTFSSGELMVTSPDDDLLQVLEKLASLLGAELVLEDEEMIPGSSTADKSGSEVPLLWPIIIVVLFILLLWRW